MTIQNSNKKRILTFFLPQFHPIPENDLWWGKGFTEWTNVTKTKPFFDGHYQPHLPKDLGFYDLRLEETRILQETLAKKFGVYGFCYYHYWFNGKRLLYEPIERKLRNSKEDLPFVMCWANENWTRRWDGLDKEILIAQDYSEEDDINHIDFLINHFFNDERYIKIDNKPFFIIYRPNLFPNLKKTVSIWREKVKESGFPDLYLGYVQSFSQNFDPADIGFDVAIEFPPHNLPLIPEKVSFLKQLIHNKFNLNKVYSKNRVHDYSNYVSKRKEIKNPNYNFFPGLTPMWDNSARKKGVDGFIFKNSTPELYEELLEHVMSGFQPVSDEENFVFINAWNEWAEGNHLEPCQKWGSSYLEATKRIADKYC